jgi:outer membrane protein
MCIRLHLRHIVLPVAIAFGLSASPTVAQTGGGLVIDVPDVRNYVALSVGVVPDYMGSDDYTVGIAPAGKIKFGNTERYAKLLVSELSVNLLNSKNWSLGPVVNYRFARDDVDDATIEGMKSIDGTVEAGVFAGWTWIGEQDRRQRFAASVSFLNDVGDEHEGYLVSASARYFQPVSRQLTLSAGVTTTYASSDYMQTYFGVDASNVGSSGLSTFSASSGIRDVRFPIMAIWSFSPNWHLAGGFIYSKLLGDASDSPVTNNRGDDNQFYTGLGVAYAW